MKPPEWFLAEMRSFDEALRLRWSDKMQMWHLERRITNSAPVHTIKEQESDDYIRARDGYVLIGIIPPRGLSRYVFQRLRECDMWANGGWQRVAENLDAMEDADHQARLEAISRENTALAADIYRLIALRERRTVYNAGFPK